MSPSTSVTRTLPARPDLDQLKRQAKDLLADSRHGDHAARARLDGNAGARLSDAQFVIAREHGFGVLGTYPSCRCWLRAPSVCR